MKNKNIVLFLLGLFFLPSVTCLWAEGIVVYGDSQHNEDIQVKLIQRILTFKPTIVFRVGDLVDDGNNPELWKRFNAIHGPLIKSTEYFPCLGNHENNSPLYFKNFPWINYQHWYSVERYGIRFIILDSNSPIDTSSDQYNWLKSELESSQQVKFIILLFHHPLFDTGEIHSEDEKGLRPVLMPLISKYKIQAVFSGHSHNYQRFQYQDSYFIVTGGGGSYLYNQGRKSPHLQKFFKGFHFCLIRPQKDYLQVEVIDIDGNSIDKFDIPCRFNKENNASVSIPLEIAQ